MEIRLSEEQLMLRETVRRFAQEVVAPKAREIDATGEFPLSFFRRAGELGFAGVMVSERYGGAGMDTISYCIVIEEISRYCASSGVILSVNNSLVCDPIERYGTDLQKERYLKPLASGAMLGCFALTEPEAGSDAASIKTRAEKVPGGYRISGTKVFITNGTHADVAIVFATLDPSLGHRGITAFLIPTNREGFRRGQHEYKLGVQASGTTQLYLDQVFVPEEDRLGAEGEGFKVALSTLDGGRIGIAAQAVGIARGALEEALSYARERRQFGKPIAEFQAIQFYLADMVTEIDAARLLTWKAAWAKEHKKRFSLEAAQAKLFASEVAQRATNRALQIHGGYGYTREYNVERYFRDARITEIYEGTSEIQKLVIADWIFQES
jgi:butyryl-CoA dehydrogenase